MDQDTIKAALKTAIHQRRSTRSYATEKVPDEIIEEILDAGRYAPSGMNRQGTSFYVITNAEKLTELRGVISGVLAGVTEEEGMSPALVSMIQRARQGDMDVTYGAPVLIVTTNMKGSPNACADCSCALQNMMLTASAHGLGNCWINQLYSFRDEPRLKEFLAGIGVSEKEEAYGSLALGYSEQISTEPLPRTGNPVIYIR
jgi:nitroreductase